MRKEPRVRKDGRCAHCRKPRVLPARARYATRTAYEADPFCSAGCCREWFGVAERKVGERT